MEATSVGVLASTYVNQEASTNTCNSCRDIGADKCMNQKLRHRLAWEVDLPQKTTIMITHMYAPLKTALDSLKLIMSFRNIDYYAWPRFIR